MPNAPKTPPKPKPVTTYAALLGRAIVHTRKRNKVTRGKLARAIGLDPKDWTPIEHGEVVLTTGQLEIVAGKMKTTVQDLQKMTDGLVRVVNTLGVPVMDTAHQARAQGRPLLDYEDLKLAVKAGLAPQAKKRSESPRKKQES
jgi:transcriptional regulator with XRE-family HTH domain